MLYRPAHRLALCAILLLSTASCKDSGETRFELTGKVTYKGKPVPAGMVRFEPLDTVVNRTTIGMAEIKDGQFKTLPDHGTTGGRQQAFVSGGNGIPEPGSGPDGASIFEEYFFEIDVPKEDSTLDIEVPDSVPQLTKF